MIANGRVRFARVGVCDVDAGEIRGIAIVACRRRHILRVEGVFLRPDRHVRVRVVNEFVRRRIVEVAMGYLHRRSARLFLATRFPRRRVILIFLCTRSTRREDDVALNVPAVRFNGLLFRFEGFRTVFVYGVDFHVRFFALFRGIPRRDVSRRGHVRSYVFVPLGIVLTRCERAFTQSWCR